MIPAFQQYKDMIPEFIAKLYHILQKKQYEAYLSWNGDDEIVIKHPKKLQEKVLPHFFRHRHFSSFIRQLNMYKFCKVPKLIKQRNHMYFKNEFFIRGNIQKLTMIKRNTKKSRQNIQFITPNKQIQSDQVSIMQSFSEDNQFLSNYKGQIKRSFKDIKDILDKVMDMYPDTLVELGQAKAICQQFVGEQDQLKQDQLENLQNLGADFLIDQQFQKNDAREMLTSQKNISNMPNLNSVMFLSQLSFTSFL